MPKAPTYDAAERPNPTPTPEEWAAFAGAVRALSQSDAFAALDMLEAGRPRFQGFPEWSDRLSDLHNWVREDLFNQTPPELQAQFQANIDAASAELGLTVINPDDWIVEGDDPDSLQPKG